MAAPLFPPLFSGPGPRLFFTPPGADFSHALARGLRARLQDRPPEAMARLRLYLNTRRTGRALTSALEAAALAEGRSAAWLPRLSHVGELAEESRRAGLPQGGGRLRRTLALMRLTEAFLAANPEFGEPASAPALAQSLRALLDELQAAGREAEDLRALDLGQHARHWSLTAAFLAIAAEAWPAWLEEEEGGAPDPETRRRLTVAEMARNWRSAPPTETVLAAGSTGSTPATAELLRAVAELPDGAVILPGWDPDMPADVWEELTGPEPRPEHPHHHQARLVASLGLTPADVAPWEAEAPPSPARLHLLTQALRPAPVTDHWLAALPELSALAPKATEGLTLLEAETPRDEAAAIAAALAAEAEAGGEAALVTPDKALARRVAAELDRWHVAPDDSAGRPLGLTPPGILLGLLAGRIGRPMTAEALAALLRHPLAAAGGDRKAHLRRLAFLERRGLRGGPREIDWARLETLLRAAADPDAPGASGATPPPEGVFDWFAWLRDALAPLAEGAPTAEACARLHLRAAETFSRGLEGDPEAELPLWEEAAGRDARAFVEELLAAAPAHGGALAEGAYGALWTTLIQQEESRPDPRRVHARIRILGALEARAETAGLMILGGLNEGVWPAHPEPDPWLNRSLRQSLGLASPERRIGLAAHDFLLAASAPRAVLSRAKRDGGGPTNPARWLVRLGNLLDGAAPGSLAAMRARGQALARAADALDHGPRLPPEPRPAPAPPVETRPRRLSVTAIETLIRDPYAIYARHILRLRKLEPIGRAPDGRDMGVALHAVMEGFALRTRDWPLARATPEALREALMQAAEEALPAAAPWPAQRRLWEKRLARAADWIAEGEARRRAEGRPLALETKAEGLFPAPQGDFKLTATADRVDELNLGGLAIYDYKTGAVPSVKQIGVFHVQLLLEAALAEAGGFKDIPAAPVQRLEYLGLSGAGAGGEARPVDLERHAPDQVRAQLLELIARFDDPATPYPSRDRLFRQGFAGDYDQLARHGEWADGGET